MGFPWAAWLETVVGGSPAPLLVATAVLMVRYLVGVVRLTAGAGPAGSPAESADRPGVDPGGESW